MSNRLRIAVIGAGYFSQYHLAGWKAIADTELVALCDTNRVKAADQAGRFGIEQTFDDVDRMLDQAQPDILDIATPPETHADLVAMAASRGLFTICQKPLAPTWKEAVQIVDTAEQAGITLVVHENFRFMPWYREARRLIDAGKLGRLHGVAFRLRPGDGQGPDAYLNRQPYFQKMTRFLVHETAIHFIDTFRYLLGEVEAVTARLRRLNPVIVGEDAAYIVLEFADGVTGIFDGNRTNDHVAENPRRTMGEMWLEGSAGVLRLDGDGSLYWKPHQGPEVEHAYDRGPAEAFGGGACEALQRHIAGHLRKAEALENRARDYLQNIRIEEAVYRSHKEGRCITAGEFEPLDARSPPGNRASASRQA